MARRRLRTTLTVLGIVIGIFALTTMGAMAEHFNALLDGGVRYFGSSIQVSASDGQARILPVSKADELKHVAGVEAVFPTYSFAAKPGGVGGVNFGIPDEIVSHSPAENDYNALKTSIAYGRDITEGARGEVVLGSGIANDLKRKVGDSVDLPVRPPDSKAVFVNHTFTVVGVLSPTRTAPDSFAYVSIPDAQILFRDTLPATFKASLGATQLAQGFTVYGKQGASPSQLDAIATRINQQTTGLKAQKPSDSVNAFKSGGATFTAITTAAAILALTERFREIGLKKAVGAHTSHVLREYLAEATLIGLVGGGLGYLLGVILTNVINLAGRASNLELFLVTPTLTAIALGFSVALGAVAGVIPAFRAARLDPERQHRSQARHSEGGDDA